jgi:hypothetical protein
MENLTAPNNSEQAPAGNMLTAEATNPQPETTQQEAPQQETAPQGAPEKYEFKAAEGQEFDPEFISSYETVARELDLSQEKAQALIDKVGPALQQQQLARLDAMRTEWEGNSRTDKEFGGDKLNENLAVAKTALEKLGTPELRELIDGSGLGNHPEVIRLFYRVGKALSEDTFVGGRKEGKGQSGPLSFNDMADRLYKQ